MRRFLLVLTLTVAVGAKPTVPQRVFEGRLRREPPRPERGKAMTEEEREGLIRGICMVGCPPATRAQSPFTLLNRSSRADDGDNFAPRVPLRVHGLSDFSSHVKVDILGGQAVEQLPKGMPWDTSRSHLDPSNWVLIEGRTPQPEIDFRKLLENPDGERASTVDLKWRAAYKTRLPILDEDVSRAEAALIKRLDANSELSDFNQKYPQLRSVRVELNSSSPSSRYAAYDGGTTPFFSGNDLGELIRQVTGQLDRQEGSVIIGLSGFTPNQKLAFATELNVQQEVFEPNQRWFPLDSADPDLIAAYQSTGMTLEGMILTKIEHPAPNQDRWHLRMRLTDGRRRFWMWLHSSSRSLIKEFAGYFANLLCDPASQLSPGLAAEATRKQLLHNHRELTEGQLDIEIQDEIRSTHLGELHVAFPPEA